MFSTFNEIFMAIFIFCVVLFLYLHIQFHLKTSDDLEIYELEQVSKDRLEEICDLRQPALIDLSNDDEGIKIMNTTNKQYLLDNYPVFEVKIRNNSELCSDTDICVPLPFHVANKLFQDDEKSIYFSEGNTDFLQETGTVKNMSYNDEYLRPYLVSNCYYDVMFASNNLETPFRYDLNYRNYYLVTQGSIKIKLAPPKSSKYLYPINDYENFEFKSPINPWKPQNKYRADFDKVKCLEILLTPGKLLYIPAYWWYSFKFDENASVSCFKYRTYMNNIAISPNIFMYALQNQNIDRKIVKPVDMKKEYVSKEMNDANIKNNNNDLDNEYNNEYENANNTLYKQKNEQTIYETLIDNNNLETIQTNNVDNYSTIENVVSL